MKILQQLINKGTNYLDFVARNALPDEVIPFSCCSWFILYEGIEKAYRDTCSDIPGAPEYHLGVIQKVVGEAIDLACGKLSSVASCRKEMKPLMERFDMLEIKQLNHSVIVPLINIVKLLDEAYEFDRNFDEL